jgi:signal transduction histidine kinase
MNPIEPVHFLLVDDLDENLLALEALLRREGLVLLKARSGTEALEHLLQRDVALALVDVQMPGMDGFELAELMRGTERTRRVPIIFVTAGASDSGRRFRGYETGAVDFLNKPIEPDVLKSKADVFYELYRQRQEVARQRDELAAAMRENARLLEQAQRYSQALKETDRRKDEFLATLAHELRNPLAPIRNGLQLLKLSAGTGQDADKARDMMERQVGHMVRLIDDLLDISRISNGKVTLRKERTTVQIGVELALEASRPLIEAGCHSLTMQVPNEPLAVDADPTRLSQILSNILNNAAKYTPEAGCIALTAERLGENAVIRVRDNGVGIAPTQISRVFDLFTQVGYSVDRSQGGLGIGLALVKKLVELHGGSVQAESAGLAKGSIFTVTLPLAPKEPSAAPRPTVMPESAVSKPSKRRILVVDDNADAAESLAMLLKFGGHEVRIAHDGPSTFALAHEFRPDILFLDIGLPGMNGFEVARLLRQKLDLTGVRLVAVSGWGSEEDRRKSQEAGFDNHLTKPVEPSQLEELLNDDFRGERHLSRS